MTDITLGWGSQKNPLHMTVVTTDFAMNEIQRETGIIMIEAKFILCVQWSDPYPRDDQGYDSQ